MIESPTRISSLAITIVVIFSIAVLEIDFSNFSQAQVQDRSMCDPNDSSVNATESKICGVPMTTNASQAQGVSDNTQPQQLSSQEKKSMCDPNDSSVNATESKICGAPMTIKNATTTTSIPSQ